MNHDPLQALVERLSDGDPEAVEQVFLNFEPYLRLVVRRRLPSYLRTKFDSVDVVQSVWVHVLRGFREANRRFVDAGHLRAFLVQAARQRLIDQWRRCRTALNRERPWQEIEEAPTRSNQPSPSEEAQARELWDRMVALCPTAHREVLNLRRAGVAVTEIANRTGLHVGSVHRILQSLACRVSVDSSASRGPRTAGRGVDRERAFRSGDPT